MKRGFIFLFWNLTIAFAYKEFNVSLSELQECKEYKIQTRSGYLYKKFYEIESDFNNANNHTDYLIRLKFYVQTTNDAHILLSTTDHPGPKDRVYEIVIGAGGNTFSIIRDNLKRGRLDYKHQGGILSSLEIVPIEITQNIGGRLEINIPGLDDQPHLAYNDSKPVLVKYVAFSSFGETPAKWYFDCKFDGFEHEIKEEDMSLSDKLSLLLTQNYQATVQPSSDMRIPIIFKMLSVNFPLRSNILKTKFQMKMSWEDKRLAWNASEYGIQTVSAGHMWTPRINIVNGARKSFKSFNPLSSSLIHSNGTVVIKMMDVTIETWCSDVTPAKNWPNDEITCDIMLGTISDDLAVFHPGYLTIPKDGINEFSDWELIEVTANNAIDMAIENVPTVLNQHPELVIQIKLRRNNAFYRNVFYAPTYVIEILFLLTFFLEGIQRCSVNFVALLLSFMGLIFIAKFSPTSYIPDIVISYEMLLIFCTVAYFLHIYLNWLTKYPPQRAPSDCTLIIINNPILRFILAIRHIDSNDFMETQKQPWKELARIVNRVAFIVAVIIVCALELTVNI